MCTRGAARVLRTNFLEGVDPESSVTELQAVDRRVHLELPPFEVATVVVNMDPGGSNTGHG